MSTAPIFAPDGTVRQIPQESVQDALSAGGKRATLMTDPTGNIALYTRRSGPASDASRRETLSGPKRAAQYTR